MLGVAPLAFQRRQFVGLLRHGVLRLDGAGLGQGQVFLGLGQFLGGLLGLALPLLALGGQGGNLRLHAVARLHHIADLGLELADLGVGLVQRALGGVHAVRRGVVRRAHRLQLGFHMA
ncbi:hypothetical protein D3C86_1435890 [compost metagenome]